MADQESKVIITIDADTGQFTSKVGGVTTQLQGLKSTGDGMFEKMSLGAIGVNQALELGQKLLEAWQFAMEALEKTEAWTNQEKALEHLAATLNLTSGQVDTLVAAVKKASGDSLTTVQAQEKAFQLLNAGFKAETIPTIIQYAEQISKIPAYHKSMDETLNAFVHSMSTGRTRDLEPFGIFLKNTGDRGQIVAATLAAQEENMKKYGATTVDLYGKMTAKSQEFKDNVTKLVGNTVGKGFAMIFGDDQDKISSQILTIEGQLKHLHEIQSAGQTEAVDNMGRMRPIDQQISELQKELVANQQKLTQSTQQSTSEMQKMQETLKGGEAAKQAITQQRLLALENEAAFKSEQERYQKGDMLVAESVKYRTKLAEDQYKKQAEEARTQTKDEGVLVNQLVELQRQKAAKIKAIQDDETKFTTNNFVMGWKGAMNSMEKEWSSWATFTQKVSQQTHNVMSKGFIDMAKAHKFSMDQMLQNFTEMIGESLIQKGTADLLMAIFPPNPGGLAAGAAEIALGSLLVGSTGGGPAGASASGAASAAQGGYGGLGPTPVTAQPEKQAQIIINGDFLNSRETANHLTDIIRQNSDITNYAIVAQGQTYG